MVVKGPVEGVARRGIGDSQARGSVMTTDKVTGGAEVEQVQWKATFRMTGPLTRSTLERDHPDPEWERLTDVQAWCWNTRLQAKRFQQSLSSEFRSGDSLHAFQWRLFATTSYDEHCLMSAAHNLGRSLKQLQTPSLSNNLPKATVRALQLLRHIYEHWDELRSGYRHGKLTRSAKKLSDEFPKAEPWSVQLLPDGDVLLANVVSIRTLVKDIRRLEARVWWRLRELRRQGRHRATKQPPKASLGGRT